MTVEKRQTVETRPKDGISTDLACQGRFFAELHRAICPLWSSKIGLVQPVRLI
ncbi:hypothetical protein HNP00_004147 [Arthrobacter sp. AZCC_0090]|nr:hypothetical protein [Arthrobacter sp. AZCC_0090]